MLAENHEEALLMHTSELKLCEVLKDVTGQAIANRKVYVYHKLSRLANDFYAN